MLDSSVALAWCFEDEASPATSGLLDNIVAHGAIAPGLWPLEVLNVLLLAEQRKRIDAQKREEFVGFLRGLPVAIDPETDTQAWEATSQLAEHHGLTLYDATYLELAKRARLPLATLDRKLQAAASAISVPLLGLTS